MTPPDVRVTLTNHKVLTFPAATWETRDGFLTITDQHGASVQYPPNEWSCVGLFYPGVTTT